LYELCNESVKKLDHTNVNSIIMAETPFLKTLSFRLENHRLNGRSDSVFKKEVSFGILMLSIFYPLLCEILLKLCQKFAATQSKTISSKEGINP